MTIEAAMAGLKEAEASYQAISPKVGSERRYAQAFWAKVISNSDATVALIRNGYGPQAFVIHRLTLEHFAYMYALLSGVLTNEKAEQQNWYDLGRASKAAEATRAVDDRRGREVLSPENSEALDELNGRPEIKNAVDHGLSIYNLLDEPDLKFMHDQFRLHSVRASHANLFSSIWNPNGAELEVLTEDVAEVLHYCTTAWENVLAGKPLLERE